ncbi:TPA: type I toxin-antitoxin system SymE family toxin [Yersinia enterocolitica]|uniref:SymE family type I addiction module toxin n=1 Tax=Yersinia enterocolitica TaxID=630 RepID=UPI001C67A04B|nr:SymE family type I addiction module toxin [Yersinia enterocolitica]MBW5835913.1 type I toxin-antitoxin system SymE family toxin [Yersinia enterocolitica]HEN3566299.1 type I toxin-antitoxin system SymE family toxin [Yersinia enterocolitica]HEN3570744.1 type I toxin-antitoxin system SymE family toxin [Yersinia enterocolitica]HEN3574325.1 type I toxin-antitoxin system SymE family toxin [Yersinia enterocolitica]HEN3577966.1 type I toxin-antitoxin system SymE family toxin [Yersinia enterocolitic
MARADSTSQSATPQARRSIVGYRPNGGQPNPYPQLTLKGRWLEALGFTTGQRIEVITEPGQLIIRIASATEAAV